MRAAYATLEDFHASQMLTVDATVDDGWNEALLVKGREIEATILFADITGFSARSAGLALRIRELIPTEISHRMA